MFETANGLVSRGGDIAVFVVPCDFYRPSVVGNDHICTEELRSQWLRVFSLHNNTLVVLVVYVVLYVVNERGESTHVVRGALGGG